MAGKDQANVCNVRDLTGELKFNRSCEIREVRGKRIQ